MTIKKNISLLILTLFISAFFMPLSLYASTGEEVKEALKVNAAWIDGEMPQVDVTNINTGENQKLEVQLKDYTSDSEYVSVQAVDPDGNKSNIVQIKNPYYKVPEPVKESEKPKTEEQAKIKIEEKENNKNAFTPAGTGEVMDNAKDGDGKEFFTIKTKSDNVFYLIVDRQRENDNVYLLNAVSESDLVALAEKGEETTGISAIPEPEPIEQTELVTETEQAKTDSSSSNNLGVILIFIVVIAAGVIGYYIKIYKPKHSDNSADTGEDFESEDNEYETNDEDFESEYEDSEGELDSEKDFEEDVISEEKKSDEYGGDLSGES